MIKGLKKALLIGTMIISANSCDNPLSQQNIDGMVLEGINDSNDKIGNYFKLYNLMQEKKYDSVNLYFEEKLIEYWNSANELKRTLKKSEVISPECREKAIHNLDSTMDKIRNTL